MTGIFNFVAGSAAKSENTPAPELTVAVKELPVHDIDIDPSRRGRAIRNLLKANHVNHAVVYKNLELNNTNAHCMSAAYILGANEKHLNTIYDEQTKDLDPWTDSPAEVIDEDWRDFLGDRNYQRAFLDFYEDKLVLKYSYDWKQELAEVLTEGDEPLINCLMGGFGHAIDHLALAYQLNSRELAMEGLSLSCIHYNALHKYLDDPSYTRETSIQSESLEALIRRLARDERLDGILNRRDYDTVEGIFEKYEDVILEYWNAWKISDATEQMRDLQQTAVKLVATKDEHAYSIYWGKLLSASHSIRVLLPLIPAKFHVSLLRQWWLWALAACFLTARPKPDLVNIRYGSADGTWKFVIDKAINGEYLADACYIKAILAMKEAATTWDDAEEFYLRSALTMSEQFSEWKD